MKAFHDLTSLGQARRLQLHAERMLASFGVEPTALRQLTTASNVIFRIDTQDGRRLVLRMTSPKSAHSIDIVRSESTWIRALYQVPDVDTGSK